ncbi:MAG: 30S ribosomal protein S3 [Candidatus Omnitrophica bacterium]|nr:30S ribosomal protein S3 [Candidatus Omnitrophota bacterium]
MGHKVHPYGLRLGINRTWQSRWFASKQTFAKHLREDVEIRAYLKKTLMSAAVARVELERAGEGVRAIIHTARPGVIIGRKGSEIDRLRDELRERTKKEIAIDIREIKNPTIEAQLVAENIAFQLEKRIAFRRAMKKAVQLAMDNGAKGIKVACGGRLAGAEMARRESYRDGNLPLSTLRADIDYGFAEARTTYGIIGVKAWIYKGDVLPQPKTPQAAAAAIAAPEPQPQPASEAR